MKNSHIKLSTQPTQPTHIILKSASIETILGPMIAIADDTKLYLLEFADRRELPRKIERLGKKIFATIVPGKTPIIQKIEKELTDYFSGKIFQFETSFVCIGSPFQKTVWSALQKIPFGETQSYLNIAEAIKKPLAFRAVANATGANSLAIIIPCHRVINTNGNLGGYAGGIHRKQWLIDHEKKT